MNKCIIYVFIAILWLSCIPFLYSQVNTEQFKKVDQIGFDNQLSGRLTFTSGNSDVLLADAGYRLDYGSPILSSFLILNYSRKTGNNEELVNKGFAHIRFMKRLSSYVQGEFFVQREFDKFLGLQDRNLVGGNLRFFIITNTLATDTVSSWNFSVSEGIFYEREAFRDGQQATTNIPRWNNIVALQVELPNNIVFSSTNYIQMNMQRSSDLRILSESSLEFLLTDAIRFTASLEYRYDNEPPMGVESFYDLNILNGVKIRW